MHFFNNDRMYTQVIPWPDCEGTCNSIPTTYSASAESYSENVGPGQGHKQSKHAEIVQHPDRTCKEPRTDAIVNTCVIHKNNGKSNHRMVVGPTNDDLEDDRAAAHPGAIPQPESPVAISHAQRVEARRSSRVSQPPKIDWTCDEIVYIDLIILAMWVHFSKPCRGLMLLMWSVTF